ncbi:MAG: LiaI-LiaF-like domain-containing protein [Candidatus Krumholzibacteriia bacterium]
MNVPHDEGNHVNPETPREQAKDETEMTATSPQTAPSPAPQPGAPATGTPQVGAGQAPAQLAGPAMGPAPGSAGTPGYGTPGAVPPPQPQVVPPGWSRATDPRRKSPTLAVMLSLMPGLGQIYLGHYQLGVIYFLIFVSLITILTSGAGGLEPLFGISVGFLVLYNLVDAGRRAALYNQALDAQASGQVPAGFEIPSNRGSTAGGIVLMALGFLFLMHTRFDFDMYWLEEWWPAGLILLGLYLFIKDRRNRNAPE